MLLLIASLQAIGIVIALLLFTRRSAAAPPVDPRLIKLPDEVLALRLRLDATDRLVQAGFAEHGVAAERQRTGLESSA